MLTIAVAQTNPAFLDPDTNLSNALQSMEHLDADVVVFPELFLSGYTFSRVEEVRRVAMGAASRHIAAIREASAKHRIAICGGYVEKGPNDELFNSAFFIADGNIVHNYRKTHLFFREHTFFAPGNTGFEPFLHRGVTFGLMICFDWIYPESARTLALKGAEVILHPANLVLPYCQRATFARAVENRVFVATSNRVGTENNDFDDHLTFTGGSQVVDPQGTTVLSFGTSEVGLKSTQIDPERARVKKLNEFDSILGGRRPEFYV